MFRAYSRSLNSDKRLRVFSSCAMLVALVSLGCSAMSAHAAPAVPVTVTNTPNVNANITNPSINVSNTAAAPLFVDADHSARNGFNSSCSTGNIDPTYGQASCTIATVPAGAKIVIETLSCQAELPANEGPADMQLIVPTQQLGSTSITNVSHMLTFTKQAGDAQLDIWRMTTPLRAYATAYANSSVGIGIFMRANYKAGIPIGMTCAISGYQIN